MAAGVALAFPDLGSDPGMAAALTGLLAWSTFRTFWLVPSTFAGTWSFPHRTAGETPLEVVAAETGVGLAVVALTGGWDSPFLLILVVAVLLAGLSRGYVGGFAAAGGIAVVLGLHALAGEGDSADPTTAAQAMLVYICTGAVAGFARRLFVEAAAEEAASAEQVARLAEVNALLSELVRVAPGVSSSLDLDDALTASLDRLADLFDFTGAAILVHDPATGDWRVSASRGLPAPAVLTEADLAAPLREAAAGGTVVMLANPGTGMWREGASGLYAPLVARGRLVALIALEHAGPGRYGPGEAKLLEGLGPPLALAVDNGLWFGRLRRLGVEAERERLARSLHDRVGAGLAYVGIELDRLARSEDPGPDLARLRKEVGGLLAEVRETLTQLRSRVTEDAGLADLAASYLPRFESRTGITTRLVLDPAAPRLPVVVEQELWRILQEALTDAERHGAGGAVDVAWGVHDGAAVLAIAQYGSRSADELMTAGNPEFEMIRERANSIGARIRVESRDLGGVRLTIEVPATSEG